jgi:hypothetical protein
LDTVLLAVSTVAACFAAGFAWWPIRDGRRFSQAAERERRLDHLLAITRTLAEVAGTASRVANAGQGPVVWVFIAELERLEVELALVRPTTLPRCREVAAAPRSVDGAHQVANVLAERARDEIATAIQATRAKQANGRRRPGRPVR